MSTNAIPSKERPRLTASSAEAARSKPDATAPLKQMHRGHVAQHFTSSIAAATRVGKRKLAASGTTPTPLVDLSGFRFVDKVRSDGQKIRIEITGSLVIPEKLAPGGVEMPPLVLPKGDMSFIVFGDSGKGTQAQREIAASMTALSRERGVQFGVHVGDIFYPHGVQSGSDPNIARLYSDLYKDIPNVHATLGNHDYGNIDGTGIPEAISEAANAGKAGFELAQRYYSRRVIAGDTTVRLIMLDTSTVAVDPGQLTWLRGQLEKDDSTYTVVVGHHPIHNNGWHGSSAIMKQLLLPMLEAKADLYLCGHEHNQQELFSDGGLPIVLSGAASEARPTWPGGHAHFTSVRRGAAFMTIDKDGIHCDFLSAYKDRVLHHDTYKRREHKPLPLPVVRPGAKPLRIPEPPPGYYRAVCDNGPLLSTKADKALP